MLTSLFLAAALTGQAPAPRRAATTTPAARPRATPAAAADQADANRRMVAKRKSKKSARYAATLDREYREAVAAEKAAEAAKKEYKEMLPYMLENQRQQLQRQTDRERNAALNRLAGAAERQAGYVYPGQSPTVGPYR